MGVAEALGAMFNLRWQAMGAVLLGLVSLPLAAVAACMDAQHEAAVRANPAHAKFNLALQPCSSLADELPNPEPRDDLPEPVRRAAAAPPNVSSERRVFLDWAPTPYAPRSAERPRAGQPAPVMVPRAAAPSLPPVARPAGISKDASSRAMALSPQINAVAAAYRIDPLLLHSIAYVESRHNPSAVSHAGARGLMQVMPATARRFGVTNPHTQLFDAQTSLEVSATYLKWLQGRFNNNLTLVIAAYNAGEGAVEKHGNAIPPYRETQQYVKSVLSHYRWLLGTRTPAEPAVRQAQVNP